MIDNSTKWKTENVQNDAIVYVRVNREYIQKKGDKIGLPNTGAFYNTPKNGSDLSSDWNKYSTPEDSRERIGKEFKLSKLGQYKTSSEFYIVSFKVQDIYDLELEQSIEHSPRQENFPDEIDGFPWNRSHCSIIGDASLERRTRMPDICTWEIPPPEYNPS